MDTSSVRQVDNLIAWSAGPVIEDFDLLVKAVLCAESLPMGIMHGILQCLLVKVKYIIQKNDENIKKRLTLLNFFIGTTEISQNINKIQNCIIDTSHENKA